MTKGVLDLVGFVDSADPGPVAVIVENRQIIPQLEAMGFLLDIKAAEYTLDVATSGEKAEVFGKLRDLGFAFSAGPGWPPSALFEQFREDGLLSGEFVEIYWTGPGERHTRVL